MMRLHLIPPVIVTFCIIFSIRRGLFSEIISFWNLFISFVLTFTFFEAMAEFLAIIIPISFILLFVSVFILSSILSNMVFGGVKIKFLSLIDKIGGALLGIIRGFIISSLIFIILAMFPAAGHVWQKKGNLGVTRNIYLIVPKIYEYLVDALSSESYFESRIFLNTYGGFLKEETRS